MYINIKHTKEWTYFPYHKIINVYEPWVDVYYILYKYPDKSLAYSQLMGIGSAIKWI